MIDRLLDWLRDHGVPQFITGERRSYFVSGWVGSTLALWICWITLAVMHHFDVAAWIGVALLPPCLGWLASLILNPLRPKDRETR